ncbi:MAG TPA: DUF2085 domain-containing protein [Bellilinea sp.]|nr:DUF2085 domain-containing protein [Bellilinea sp.]
MEEKTNNGSTFIIKEMPKILDSKWYRALRVVLPILLIILFVTWWTMTPDGVFAKPAALGYPFCHEIPSHSLTLGGQPLPICARCTGMYLAVAVSLIALAFNGPRTRYPAWKFIAIFAVFFVLFAVDGVNSLISTAFHKEVLYTPSNWLRLFTGAGMGMLIPVALLPLFNQSLWAETDPRPILTKWSEVLGLILLSALIALAAATDVPAIVVPLAYLSVIIIPVLLALCYATLWVMLTRTENRYHGWKDAWLPLVVGFIFAFIQIGLFSWMRYSMTGTWGGFQL